LKRSVLSREKLKKPYKLETFLFLIEDLEAKHAFDSTTESKNSSKESESFEEK
jgi:hypothetical protein